MVFADRILSTEDDFLVDPWWNTRIMVRSVNSMALHSTLVSVLSRLYLQSSRSSPAWIRQPYPSSPATGQEGPGNTTSLLSFQQASSATPFPIIQPCPYLTCVNICNEGKWALKPLWQEGKGSAREGSACLDVERWSWDVKVLHCTDFSPQTESGKIADFPPRKKLSLNYRLDFARSARAGAAGYVAAISDQNMLSSYMVSFPAMLLLQNEIVLFFSSVCRWFHLH